MTRIAIGLTLLTCLLWGGTPTAIRFAVDSVPPVMVAALRFGIAVLFMVPWCIVSGSGFRLSRKGALYSILLGGLLFGQIATFNLGITLGNASHGTLLINTFIFWVVAIEHFSGRERITRVAWMGVLVAAAGVLLMSQFDRVSPTGDLILLASAAILGVKIVVTKRATAEVRPATLILWHDVVGTILFFSYSFLFESTSLDDFTTAALIGIGYQGVFVAGLCFVLQAELLKRHPAHQIAIYSFTTPLFGMVIAMLIRGESASPWLAVSAVAVAIGILLVTRKHSPAPSAS